MKGQIVGERAPPSQPTDNTRSARDTPSSLMALDLFCGAGGASMGLHRAGFGVVGIDIKPQPRYPFQFIQADALAPPVDLSRFDLIWASPPCQAFVDLRWMYNAKTHDDLIPEVRGLLERSCRPFVIENVDRAPLRSAARLCGTQFGLGTDGAELWRHRHFEVHGFRLPLTFCRHGGCARVIGVYGGHGRDRRRRCDGQDFSVAQRREAMGIDWMNGNELSQAIPPAYSEFIGREFLGAIEIAAKSEERTSSPDQGRAET